jgi:glucosamine--fructose-6-phosphate aminotransferase (isomerizing)
MAQTITACDPIAQNAAESWLDGTRFVFCGSGPNYGTALFSAAKLIEASGDGALGQDVEEWAHLQYFGKQPDTPTFLLSAGQRDADRTAEIAVAAKQIGRRVALIAPEKSVLLETAAADFRFPLPAAVRECFSPLAACLPGTLFAAHRAQMLNEPYFRGFGGGRSQEGGGGVSRIRSSHRIDRVMKDE